MILFIFSSNPTNSAAWTPGAVALAWPGLDPDAAWTPGAVGLAWPGLDPRCRSSVLVNPGESL